MEVGLRVDDGDAVNGRGVELAAGFGYESERLGLAIESRGRLLLAHQGEGFEEWGMGANIKYDPGVKRRGFRMSLAPQWGNAESGVNNMWSGERVVSGNAFGVEGSSVNMIGEMSYERAGVTPFTAFEVDRYGHSVGVGGRITASALNLEILAEREDFEFGPVNHGVQIQVTFGNRVSSESFRTRGIQ